MSLFFQIMLGSVFLALCSAIHLALILWAIHLIKGIDNRHKAPHGISHFGQMIGAAFAVIVFSHTTQIWIWALSFIVFGALPDVNDAIYFSLVTYTTLGYGDVTVANDFRTFAAMAAVTGLLNFGLSTAFLVGLLTKLLEGRMK